MFRISLFKGANGLAKELTVLAAQSNGSENKHKVSDLKNVFEGQRMLYPSLYDDVTCEVIGEHTLHIDKKVGEGYETVLILDEITVMDLSEAPTLSRYDAQSIIKEIEQPNSDQN